MLIDHGTELDQVVKNSWNSPQYGWYTILHVYTTYTSILDIIFFNNTFKITFFPTEKIIMALNKAEDDSRNEESKSGTKKYSWTVPNSDMKGYKFGMETFHSNQNTPGNCKSNYILDDDDSEHVILFAPTYNTFSLYLDSYYTHMKRITSNNNSVLEECTNKKRKRSVRFADECTYFRYTESTLTECAVLGVNASVVSAPNDSI